MNETTARDICAARALETTDDARMWWTDEDRARVSRAAAEAVGAGAAPEAFLARRAALVVARAGARSATVARTVRAVAWRHWIAPAVLVVAFVAGLGLDQVGSGGRIDILAPPVLALLVWNLAVYLVVAARAVAGMRRASAAVAPAPAGAVRHALAWLASPARHRDREGGVPAAAMTAFVRDWAVRSRQLYAARAARILHLAAAALAVGVIAGLYLRGLALEYRAGWESTFLDARQVHALVATALAPGAALLGMPVPDVEHVAALRRDVLPQGENAALWVHLYAATILLVVIAPRLLLAIAAWLGERRSLARLTLDLGDPHARRVLRDFAATPARVLIAPYSYTPTSEVRLRLATVLQRALGASTAVEWRATTAYGGEDADALATPPGTDLAIALFNATATPELESHVAFAARLRAGGAAMLALVDASGFRSRWPNDTERLAAREAAWRKALGERDLPVVVADLALPDAAPFEAALAKAMER